MTRVIPSALKQALRVLLTSDPLGKVEQVKSLKRLWDQKKSIGKIERSEIPETPARPKKPDLVDPNKVPRRRLGSTEGRAAMLHAIAHIELNAIDLACDMIARFTHADEVPSDKKEQFVSDWISVASDEARHFEMLQNRLNELGYSYGDFPAHNGLWEAAETTNSDVAARLAIAPLVLEARGLDVTPAIIKKLTNVNDCDSVVILKTIYREEVNHVAIGIRWFNVVAKSLNQDPTDFFKTLVKTHFKGQLKPPFNVEARTLAGMPGAFYAS